MDNSKRSSMLRKLKILQWPMYVICVLCYMLTLFHRITPAIMGPDLMADLSLGAVAFGFMGMAFTWIYAFAQAPVGTMLDSLGARRGLTAILIIAAIGSLVFSLAENFTVLIIGRILLAVAVSGFLIGGAKIISAWFTTRQYPMLWGIFMGLGSLGSVLGTAPLRTLMSFAGWRTALFGIAVFSLILAVVTYSLLRDKPAERGLLTPDELHGETAVVSAISEEAGQEKVPFTAVLKMPVLWLIGLLSLGVNSSSQTFGSMWEGIYLTDALALSKEASGDILSWYAWGLFAGCILSGAVVRKIGSKKTMVLGCILFLFNWLWIALQPATISITELSFFNFLMGALQMLVISTTFIYIREVMPTSRLGTAMGIVNSFAWIFGAGLFQQIWGIIINAVSDGIKPYPVYAFQVTLWLQVIMICLGVICSIVLYRKDFGGKEKSVKLTNHAV